MENLIRRRIMRRLIWVCTISQIRYAQIASTVFVYIANTLNIVYRNPDNNSSVFHQFSDGNTEPEIYHD